MNRRIILAVIVALTLLFIYQKCLNEGFTTKRSKAQAINNWFQKSLNPRYADYKRDLSQASNIVEYEDALALFQNKNLTVESVEKIL